jgi:branched-subunit amino acid aminotransferase/4-amino-4-deoxychorismate lyase
MAEASMKSVAIVSQERILKYPKFDQILKSTVLLRAVELAKGLVKSGELNGISQTNISHQDVYDSLEIFEFMSGHWVVPVVRFDGRTIGTGKPGPVFHQLWDLLKKDSTENVEVLTPVPYQQVETRVGGRSLLERAK